VLAALIWLICPAPELRHRPGWRVEADPIQTDGPPEPLGKILNYDVTAVASYEITARVLGTKRYWGDHQKLAPYDVALGWGPMSDQVVIDQLEFSQGNRFFFYHWAQQPPIPLPEIVRHASNHHVISANRKVASAVADLRRGQCVRMRGRLVNVTRPDGFHWNTSTTRSDNGNGACEIFYVEEITVADELPAARVIATK
jgi:hypothetical protein